MLLRMSFALTLALVLTVSTVGLLPAQAAPATAGTVIVQLDNPSQGEQNMTPTWIAGWAIDTASSAGPGVDSVMVYIDGDATTGRLLGQAKYGGDRPDVAAQYGNPAFRFSGFVLELGGWNIPLGTTHTFTVVATSRLSGASVAAATGVTLAQPTNPYMLQPTYGATGQYSQQYNGQQYGQQYNQSQYGQQPYTQYGQQYAQQPYGSNAYGSYNNGSYGSSYNPYASNGYTMQNANNGYYGNVYNTNGYYGNSYNPYSSTSSYYNGSYLNPSTGSYMAYPTGYGYGSTYPSYNSSGYGSTYPSYNGYGYGSAYPSYNGYGYGSYYGQRYSYPGYTPFK